MLFKHLFAPHEIRGLEIRNRIFSTGHQTILAEKAHRAKRWPLITKPVHAAGRPDHHGILTPRQR